jgi:hypothetical protein
MNDFITNHGQPLDDIIVTFQNIILPDDIKKKEMALRKELNKYYKNRGNIKSKALAIYVSFEHSKLLLSNPKLELKNFAGLQKLQSNWKAEEYFDALITLMHAFKETFPNLSISEKISKDIDRTFELWNSRNIAKEVHENNIAFFIKAESASDKHFAMLGIIEYLDRRCKFNPQYRNELVEWCEKDIKLYEQFLVESHEHALFSIDDQIKFMDNPDLKQKKLSKISFEKVKRLKYYLVPRLNSYDVLEHIYKQENNTEKLLWLREIGQHIRYTKNSEAPEEKTAPIEELNVADITHTIEVSKSGQKGKLAFLRLSGEPCSTEDAFTDNAERSGWNVMRAEVSFWQAMFCLSFWEDIFDEMGQPIRGKDIPHDLFDGEAFYQNRQPQIDAKYESIKQQNLQEFINQQIKRTQGTWTRLVYDGDQDMISYLQTPTAQAFLSRIDPDIFAKIIYRIAQNPSENRAGLSDFVVWNEQMLKMVEVKRVREQIRESQRVWLSWMIQEGIPVEIVRVKGVLAPL